MTPTTRALLGVALLAGAAPAGAQTVNFGPCGIYGCTDPTGATSDVSSCGGPLTFRFDLTSTAAIRMDDLAFAFRSQSVGATGRSTRCYSSDAQGTQQACEPWTPPTVTPEPATVVVMASGLRGVSGVVGHRRRGEG